MARNSPKTEPVAQGQPNPMVLANLMKVRIDSILPQGGAKAEASISFNDDLIIAGFRVCDGKNGLFVSPPDHRAKGQWVDSCYAKSKELREFMSSSILNAYAQAITQGQSDLMAAQQRAVNGAEEAPGMQMGSM